jgi:quercetin dioxygenase-like cupin family protein
MEKQARTVKSGEGEKMTVLGAEVRFLCPAQATGKAWSLLEAVLPMDAGPPPHEHPWDEAYYVLEGEIRFTLADQVQLVKAGDFIYAPGGTVHAFQGASASPARLLVFDQPGHAEQFFRDVDREIRNIPADLPKVPEIGARHQLRFRSLGQ